MCWCVCVSLLCRYNRGQQGVFKRHWWWNMATSLGVQVLLCLTKIFSPKRTWHSSAMLLQLINRNRFLNSKFATSSHSLLGRRAGWSQLGHNHSSSLASCTLHRQFPTNSRSFLACPERDEDFDVQTCCWSCLILNQNLFLKRAQILTNCSLL